MTLSCQSEDRPTWENLILLCGYHHRFLNEHGWTIEMDASGRHTYRRPDGRLHPPPTPGLDPRLQVLVGRRT